MRSFLFLLAILLPQFVFGNSTDFCIDGISYRIIDKDDSMFDPSASQVAVAAYGSGYEKHLEIPEKVDFDNQEYCVVAIDAMAFYENTNLESVTIPNSVMSIGEKCFMSCKKLYSVSLSSNIKELPWACFINCISLQSIILPEGIECLGEKCFESCYALKSINLPESLNDLGSFCFNQCKSLQSVKIPSKITKIKNWCFHGCSSLVELTIPETVEEIGVSAFALNIGSTTEESVRTINFGKSSTPLTIETNGIDYSYYVMKVGRELKFSYGQNLTISNLIITEDVNDLSWLNEMNNVSITQITTVNPNPPMGYLFSQWEYENTKLFIPKDNVNNYENNEIWGFFKNIIPLDLNPDEYNLDISKDHLSLNVGENSEFSYFLDPKINSSVEVRFSSNNFENTLCEFDDGYIYALSPGETSMYVISGLNGQVKRCDIDIIQPVTEVVLNKNNLTLNDGTQGTLYVKIYPSNASDQTVLWVSSNMEVATVDNKGVVTAQNVGSCMITAIANNGKSASCSLTVIPTLIEEIIIEPSSVEGKVGDVFNLTAKILPEIATDKSVTWIIDNPEVAVIDEDGILTLIGVGQTIAQASANDESGVSKICLVMVLPILVDSISLNPSFIRSVKDLEVQIEAKVFPDNATQKMIDWESDNPGIAIVDENGLVKILEIGDCRIIAKTIDGSDVEAVCIISEVDGVESIFIEGLEFEVYTINGILVGKEYDVTLLQELPNGIYILRSGFFTVIVKI